MKRTFAYFSIVMFSIIGAQAQNKTISSYKAQAIELSLDTNNVNGVTGGACFTVDKHFVWGGAPIKAQDGKYYLIYSAFSTDTMIFNEAWVLGSKFGLAVSDSPEGNYKHLGFFLNSDGFNPDSSSWDAQTVHNPHIRYYNDTYYLYYIGAIDPKGKVPISSTGKEMDRRNRVQQNLTVGVISFKSFDDLLTGNFKHSDKPLMSPRTRVKPNNIVNPSPEGTKPLPDNIIMVNPAIVYRPSDQKYLLYFKGNIYDPTWRGVHGVAIADSPDGPFTPLDKEIFIVDIPNGEKLSAEDPYVWFNSDDNLFYAIFKDFTGRFTKEEPCLAIMYSEDGIDRKLPDNSLFMRKELILANGERVKVNRLERPQLLLDERGNPLVLFAACAINDVNGRKDGGSFNVQIPLTQIP